MQKVHEIRHRLAQLLGALNLWAGYGDLPALDEMVLEDNCIFYSGSHNGIVIDIGMHFRYPQKGVWLQAVNDDDDYTRIFHAQGDLITCAHISDLRAAAPQIIIPGRSHLSSRPRSLA